MPDERIERTVEYANDGAPTFGRFIARITHADLTAVATGQAIALSHYVTRSGFPANAIPLAAHVELDTPFAGGTVSAITVAVGDTAAPTELLTATNVFTGQAAGVKSAAGAAVGKFIHEVAYAPLATFALTGDNAVNVSAGALYVVISYVLAPPVSG